MRKYAEIFIYLVTVNFPYIVCSVSISAVATFWTTFYSNKNVAGSKPTKWVPFNLSRPIWSVQMCLIINFDKVVLAPDWFSGQVGLYQPLGLVTSCSSQKTVCKLLADVRVREHWWPQFNLNVGYKKGILIFFQKWVKNKEHLGPTQLWGSPRSRWFVVNCDWAASTEDMPLVSKTYQDLGLIM